MASKQTDEYLRRNLVVAKAVGVRAGIRKINSNLPKRTPKWMRRILDNELGKMDAIVSELAEHREEKRIVTDTDIKPQAVNYRIHWSGPADEKLEEEIFSIDNSEGYFEHTMLLRRKIHEYCNRTRDKAKDAAKNYDETKVKGLHVDDVLFYLNLFREGEDSVCYTSITDDHRPYHKR